MSVLQKIFGSAGLRSRDDVGSAGLRPRDDAPQAATQTPEEELVVALNALDALRTEIQDIAHPFDEDIREIQERRTSAIGERASRVMQLEHRIKDMAVKLGKNVFGSELKAEYVHASQTVDVKGLMGYAVDHPGVKQFIQDGKPSCRIKTISAAERKKLSLAALN